MQTKRVILLSRFLLIAAFIVISYLATTKTDVPIVEDMNDKANHVLAFFALALLADFSWPASEFNAPKILSLLGYGLAIEIVQYFLPSRSFFFTDFGADIVGLFLYWLTVPLLKTLPLFKGRWELDT